MTDQAFPSTFHNGWGEPEKGMTLRDYFAAQALNFCLLKCWDDDGAAERAYRIADFMLEQRNN